MDFAIRTISFAISMRISSSQLQRKQGPDMGAWGKLVVGRWEGEKKAGQPPPPTPLAHVAGICRDIMSRGGNRQWLFKAQTCS